MTGTARPSGIGEDARTAAGSLEDDARAAICAALGDDRFWTAGELSHQAGVALPVAREYLAHLVAHRRLTAVHQSGREYLRLRGPHAARVLEALASPAGGVRTGEPRRAGATAALRSGRTCYGHLAGRLGMSVTEALIRAGVITAAFDLSDLAPLEPLRIEVPRPGSGPMVRACLDWTERRHHAAGALPTAMARRLLELDWLRREPCGRAVQVTAAGRRGLADLLNLGWSQDPVAAPA